MKGARHIIFFGLLAVLVMQVEECAAKPCILLGGAYSFADSIQKAFANFGRALATAFGNTGNNPAAGASGSAAATPAAAAGGGNQAAAGTGVAAGAGTSTMAVGTASATPQV